MLVSLLVFCGRDLFPHTHTLSRAHSRTHVLLHQQFSSLVLYSFLRCSRNISSKLIPWRKNRKYSRWPRAWEFRVLSLSPEFPVAAMALTDGRRKLTNAPA